MGISFNPVNGSFNGKKPFKRSSSLESMKTLESILRYDPKDVIGKFYPARHLPGLCFDQESECAIVLAAGDVVTAAPVVLEKYAEGNVPGKLGINDNGVVTVSVGVDGTKIERPYTALYNADTAGIVFPLNGTGTDLTINYLSTDGEAGILTPSGEIPTASDTFVLKQGFEPIGVIMYRALADIRDRFQGYSPQNPSVAVCRHGHITVPFVSIVASETDDVATALTAFKALADPYHQYVLNVVEDTAADDVYLANLVAGKDITVSERGKLSTVSSYKKFGKVVSVRGVTIHDLDELIDTFPMSDIQGTATGGVSSRMYDFAKAALKELGGLTVTPTIVNESIMVPVDLKSGAGTGKFMLGLVDIIF